MYDLELRRRRCSNKQHKNSLVHLKLKTTYKPIAYYKAYNAYNAEILRTRIRLLLALKLMIVGLAPGPR
jgi:hypothetical protein